MCALTEKLFNENEEREEKKEENKWNGEYFSFHKFALHVSRNNVLAPHIAPNNSGRPFTSLHLSFPQFVIKTDGTGILAPLGVGDANDVPHGTQHSLRSPIGMCASILVLGLCLELESNAMRFPCVERPHLPHLSHIISSRCIPHCTRASTTYHNSCISHHPFSLWRGRSSSSLNPSTRHYFILLAHIFLATKQEKDQSNFL